jgi:hypothetical protein
MARGCPRVPLGKFLDCKFHGEARNGPRSLLTPKAFYPHLNIDQRHDIVFTVVSAHTRTASWASLSSPWESMMIPLSARKIGNRTKYGTTWKHVLSHSPVTEGGYNGSYKNGVFLAPLNNNGVPSKADSSLISLILRIKRFHTHADVLSLQKIPQAGSDFCVIQSSARLA